MDKDVEEREEQEDIAAGLDSGRVGTLLHRRVVTN
jgi:hypothetical protein